MVLPFLHFDSIKCLFLQPNILIIKVPQKSHLMELSPLAQIFLIFLNREKLKFEKQVLWLALLEIHFP